MVQLINVIRGDVWFLFLFLYMVFLPVNYNFATISIALAILINFGSRIKSRNIKFYFSDIKEEIIIVSYFLIVVAGAALGDLTYDLKYFERFSSFLILPLFFNSISLDKQKLNFLLLGFIIGLVIYLIICTLNVYIQYQKLGTWYIVDPNVSRYRYPIYMYSRFSPLVQPIYGALNLVIGVFVVLYAHRIKLINLTALLTFSLFFSIGIILLASRAVSLIFIITLFSFFYITFSRRDKYILLGAFFLLILMAFLSFDQPFMKRYKKTFKELEIDKNTSGSIRMQTNLLALEAIQNSPVWGYGTNMTSTVLQHTYNERYKNEFTFYAEGKNSHNQYLENYIQWGIIGLTQLTVMLLFFLNSLEGKEFVALKMIPIVFALLFLTECLLLRAYGILSFVTFFCIFIALKRNLIKRI